MFEISFDPDSPEIVSDLRVLVTIKTVSGDDTHIYRDSSGTRENVQRRDYVSEAKTPRVVKQDEISIATNWPKSGGPNIVLLPEGQRLLLGELPEGISVDVSLWRTFIMAQNFTNRILVRRTPNGVKTFAPKVVSITDESPSVFSSGTQAREVASILDSVSDAEAPKVKAPEIHTSTSPKYSGESINPDSEAIDPVNIEESQDTPALEMEIVAEPELVDSPEPELVEVAVLEAPAEVVSEKKQGRFSISRIFVITSDVLITLAILAVLYAGYQTVWTGLMSQKSTDKAVSELEVQWKEDPTVSPVLHKGFALAYIPRLKDKVWGLPITQGVEAEDLTAGLGHYVQTPLPGEEGNFAIAGHRSTYGEPLANIDQLQQDDEVIIRTGTNWYTYKLIMTAIVEPDEMWTIEENPGGLVNATGVKEMITLTTCDPRWGSTHRWVWWGTLEKVSPIDEAPEVIGTVQ
jgi:sortase A